jgi:hypothetical protein
MGFSISSEVVIYHNANDSPTEKYNYSFHKVTQFSKGNTVLDTIASNIYVNVPRDMHVSSFQPTGAFLHKANVFQLEH